MVEYNKTITDPEGLHARPAAAISILANKQDCECTLRFGTQTANAKSIMEIMGFAAKQGDALCIKCCGQGEHQAIEQFIQLFDKQL